MIGNNQFHEDNDTLTTSASASTGAVATPTPSVEGVELKAEMGMAPKPALERKGHVVSSDLRSEASQTSSPTCFLDVCLKKTLLSFGAVPLLRHVNSTHVHLRRCDCDTTSQE